MLVFLYSNYGLIGLFIFVMYFTVFSKHSINSFLWECIKVYTNIESEYNNSIAPYVYKIKCVINPQLLISDKDENLILMNDTMKISYHDNTNENINKFKNYIRNEELSRTLFLYKKTKQSNKMYKRVSNIKNLQKDIDIEMTRTPLIFVELEYNETTIDITSFMKDYYVVGNILFDNLFMMWLFNQLLNSNNVTVPEYKISFIDSNMERQNLTSDNYLICESDKFSINNINTL